jgi:hypothetical protein
MNTNHMTQMELNFAPKSVPSISSSSMLVELTIGVWTGRKQDRKAGDDVTAANNANKGVARVTKSLLGACEELDALMKYSSNVRNWHYNSTLPWSDTGPRLLPTPKYFAYQQHMTALQGEFFRMVDDFLAQYDLEVAAAQAKLGDLFDVREYPNVDELRGKFTFRFNYIPLADAGDWRLDIANEAFASLKEQYETHYTNQLTGAMKDIWQRLFDILTTLSRQLSDKTEEGKSPRIFASVFERMVDVLDLMETCNLTGDMNMQLMQRKLSVAFRGVNAETVKDDAYLRRATKKAVDEAIKSLPSLDW